MRLSGLFLVFLLLSRIPLFADVVFVQEETQQTPGRTNKIKQTTKVKNGKMRIDMDAPGFSLSVIHNRITGGGMTLFHQNKTYVEANASNIKEGAEKTVDQMEEMGRLGMERPKIQATGKKGLINGWQAEEYVAESEFLKATYWFAKELLPLHQEINKTAHDPRYDALNQQFPDPASFPGMPVLTTREQKMSDGATIKTTVKLISIKAEPVSESEFSVPAGYKKANP
jgi:hypothetical protein